MKYSKGQPTWAASQTHLDLFNQNDATSDEAVSFLVVLVEHLVVLVVLFTLHFAKGRSN